MKLLVVEDDESSRVYLQRALKAHGYQVTTTANGVEAIEAIQDSRPDLIISDILMPKMDGFELCRRIKADESLKSIPFIFYTSTYLDPHDRELGLSIGASTYLEKPMELPEFLNKIAEVLADYEQGKLPVHEAPLENDGEIDAMYASVVTRKLDQKVLALGKANKELIKSEAKYRRLIESLTDEYFFYTHGVDGVFTYISPSILNILGYTPEEFLKHYETYFTDNPINTKATQHTELGLQGEVQHSYEIELYHKDGSKRNLEVKEVPVLDDSGQVIALEGVAHDITDKKKVEAELAKYRDHLEELVEKRTEELHKKSEELNLFNAAMVDREMRLIELKEEVNQLAVKQGIEPPYPPVWEK